LICPFKAEGVEETIDNDLSMVELCSDSE